MERIIATIPVKHTAHTLLGTIAWLREDPENRLVKPRDYFAEPMTLAQFMDWFRSCWMAKANRDEKPRGRKDCSDWDRAARDCARWVNTPRLRVYTGMIPFEFRSRLAHRIATD
jgi:hypothetical protein